jgi:uncharacterized membrane protein
MFDNSENNLYIIELDEGLYNNNKIINKKSSNGKTAVIVFAILALFYIILLPLNNLFNVWIIIVAAIVSFFVIGLICTMNNGNNAFALLLIISILLCALATIIKIKCNDDIQYALKMYELTKKVNADAKQLAKGSIYNKTYDYDYSGKEELTLCFTFYLTSIVYFITSFLKLIATKNK